jgi:hypothetical protein
VCALLTLDLNERDLIKGGIDKIFWTKFLTKENLYSDMWLLAYEADFKGWLEGIDKNFIEKDHFFRKLKELKVSFYDERVNVPFIKRKKKSDLRLPAKVLFAKHSSKNYDDDWDDLSVDNDVY